MQHFFAIFFRVASSVISFLGCFYWCCENTCQRITLISRQLNCSRTEWDSEREKRCEKKERVGHSWIYLAGKEERNLLKKWFSRRVFLNSIKMKHLNGLYEDLGKNLAYNGEINTQKHMRASCIHTHIHTHTHINTSIHACTQSSLHTYTCI